MVLLPGCGWGAVAQARVASTPVVENRAIEMLGDQWSLVILRDIALHDMRSFRELCASNAEWISAPVLSRRLTDLSGVPQLVGSRARFLG